MSTKLQLKSNIIEIMEQWAKWLSGPSGQTMGYGTNVLERLIRGMPSTRCRTCDGEGEALRDRPNGSRGYDLCPDCQGSGRINLKPTTAKTGRACQHCRVKVGDGWESKGEIEGRTCIHCRGSGRIMGESIHHKANPATIPSTAHYQRDDSLMYQVDRIICALPDLHKLVAWQEYLRIGRQHDKCLRVGIGREKYLSVLAEVHAAVEEGIG
jgi:hypothetical protein